MRVIIKEGLPLDRMKGGGGCGGQIEPGPVPFGCLGFLTGTQEERDRQVPRSVRKRGSQSYDIPLLPAPPPAFSPQAPALCSNQGGGLERSVWANWK